MLLSLLLACPANRDLDTARPGDADTAEPSGDTSADTSEDTGVGVAEGCRAQPAAADRPRVVATALPYTRSGAKANVWALLTLSESGELSDEGVRFEMGRATWGEVIFTPDGSLGLVPQEDGTVGIFTPDGVVVDAGVGGFYASRVVMDPSGERAWVVDGNWANNGGGIYELPLDCETGAPGTPVRVTEGKLPADLLLLGTGVLVAGREVPGSDAGADLALLDTPGGAVIASVDAFGDDEAIVSDAELTLDGRFALLGDNSAFSGIENRVAIVAVGDESLTSEGSLEVYDPMSILAFDELVLVASGYGDALVGLTYDPSAGTPFRSLGEVQSSQLPGQMVAVRRGELDGLVLVSEVDGLRVVRVNGTEVSDDGVFALGDELEGIVGAVGVQP